MNTKHHTAMSWSVLHSEFNTDNTSPRDKDKSVGLFESLLREKTNNQMTTMEESCQTAGLTGWLGEVDKRKLHKTCLTYDLNKYK